MIETPKAARRVESDGVVIVGAGLAGLFTALKLAPLPVTVVSAARFGEGGSSFWAQAGIAAAVAEGDTPADHAADTVTAGAGIVEEKIALLMAEEARGRIQDLLTYGVPFDRDLKGHFSLSREAAHGRNRILHVQGDTAGRAIMAALVEAVRRTPSIEVLEGYAARDLLVEDGRVTGVQLEAVKAEGRAKLLTLAASSVVLATGGAGQIYAITTNPRQARGEGIAIAARAGAIIADAEFVQFHPTAINIGRDPAPLATEALRGEGATLINARGERFMRSLHDDAELAPRDIVARAVHREVASGRGAFLDCRGVGSDLSRRFPTVSAICREAGIDPLNEPIPIAPAAHYHMGGILTDACGRTSIDGLWACGEVASTGAHGANRLASNSLLEAVVFGARVAADISATQPAPVRQPAITDRLPARASSLRSDEARAKLRDVMSANVGVIRDEASLRSALTTILTLEHEGSGDRSLINMLTTAKLVAAAALQRRESRGAHFRSDYPQASDALAHRSFLLLTDAEAIAREAVTRERAKPRLALVHA